MGFSWFSWSLIQVNYKKHQEPPKLRQKHKRVEETIHTEQWVNRSESRCNRNRYRMTMKKTNERGYGDEENRKQSISRGQSFEIAERGSRRWDAKLDRCWVFRDYRRCIDKHLRKCWLRLRLDGCSTPSLCFCALFSFVLSQFDCLFLQMGWEEMWLFLGD